VLFETQNSFTKTRKLRPARFTALLSLLFAVGAFFLCYGSMPVDDSGDAVMLAIGAAFITMAGSAVALSFVFWLLQDAANKGSGAS